MMKIEVKTGKCKREEGSYPCEGHDCYDRGNYHATCWQCPLHKANRSKKNG